MPGGNGVYVHVIKGTEEKGRYIKYMRTQTDRTRVKAIMVTAAMRARPHKIVHIYARIGKVEPAVETVMRYDLRSRALVGVLYM